MGLDMFLYGANRRYDSESRKEKINMEEVMYWRKQNAVHKWFVDNVQNGTDNCAMYFLTYDDLKQLLALCNKVLKNPTVENAMEVLPTKDGFFFGGTDLSLDYEMDYYLEGIKATVKGIRELFNENYDFFYYCSSW